MVRYDQNSIYIDGKPTKIASGAMHYFRIVPEYWEDRLLKLKESGCNCVETYLCWNLHEKKQGQLDFSGWLDFGKFLEIAKGLGLYAIVRPGPYICSEWDMGGMPWWLLKYPDVELRCSNERFLQLCTPYLDKVCDLLKPHLITNGGNVIFVQIENEYGSYSNDKAYLQWLKRFYEERGIDCGLITSDGETDMLLKNGSLDGVMASVNYRKDSQMCLSLLKNFKNDQPGAAMELWNGRAMHWGEAFQRRDVEEVKESVRSALEYGELVNMYMFHGGTTFGFMNGALDFGDRFIVQMTSYDVDAPLDEYGRRTKKYYAEQEVITQALGTEITNTAVDTELFPYEQAHFCGACSLEESGVVPAAIQSPQPRPMELYDQGYGYIIYETSFFVDKMGATLRFPEVHDIGHIYIDGQYTKTLERYSPDKTLELAAGEHHMAILVENMGRVNFGPKLKDHKGLVGQIVLYDHQYCVNSILSGFRVYPLPLETLPASFAGTAIQNQPAFYEFTFEAEAARDTVMHLRGFTRGVAFINGINLGRHWDIEHSENKLFIPATFVKPGLNRIVVFDVLHKDDEKKIIFGEL